MQAQTVLEVVFANYFSFGDCQLVGRRHPSRDVIFSGQSLAKKAKNDRIA